MSEFPGFISGFSLSSTVQMLSEDVICLHVESPAYVLNSITLDGREIPSERLTIAISGGYRQYCFLPEIEPGLHLAYVMLTTSDKVFVYSWEFTVDLR